MTIGFARFGKQFASTGNVSALSDAQANAGWAFLGTSPPTVEEFNAMMQGFDDKDNWLFGNIQTLATNAGVAAPADGDFTTLYKSIVALTISGIAPVTLAGTATAYTMANTLPLTAYVNGQRLRGKVQAANTGSATLKVDTLAAIPIFGLGGIALQGGEMPINSIATFEITISATLNGGSAVAVLQEAVGGPSQVATPTQPNHATTYALWLAARGNYGAPISLNVNTTLTASQAGSAVQWFGTTNGTFTLPAMAAMISGQVFRFYNQGTGTLTITVNNIATEYFSVGAATNPTSIVLQPGDNLTVEARGGTEWDGVSGSALLQFVSVKVFAMSGGGGHAIGTAVNMKAIQVTASATLTLSADEIVVGTALGGSKATISGWNSSVVGSQTGIGGIDTGTIAANTYYAIYAAWNPTTGAKGFFAQAEPVGGATSVYSGANLPAGYTFTALASIWLSNSSSLFQVASQYGRVVNFASVGVYNGSGSVNLAAITIYGVPKTAKFASGILSLTVSAAGISSYSVFSQTAVGATWVIISVNTGNATSGGNSNNFSRMPILTPQSWWISSTQGATISNMNVAVAQYEF